MTQKDDIYIVSDLHIGSGLKDGSVRFSRLEGFFYDDVFDRFINKILETQTRRSKRATLILGGDIFDCLCLTELPTRLEARTLGIQVTRDVRRFGLGSTPKHAEWKIRRIAKGHPLFFESLGRFLASGHQIVLVSGNHDAELYWARVRETAFELIMARAIRIRPDIPPKNLRERLVFRHWFYREAGRFYFEHGNQYEASNSFRYNLCPVQPTNTGKVSKNLDPPVGSLFARYIVNESKRRNPYLTNLVSMEQYMGALASMNLMDMLGVFIRRTPFFVRALNAARMFESNAWNEVKSRHCNAISEVAQREELDPEAVREIQHLRAMPDGMTKYHLALNMLKPVAYKILKYLLFVLAAMFIWFAVFSIIQNTPWLAASVLGKASLTALLAMISVTMFLLYLNRVTSKVHQMTVGAPLDIHHKARAIAKLTGVKHVIMGHTHMADLRRLPNSTGFYANTGTWIATTGSWDFLWPNSRRYTFVRIRGDKLSLLRFNDQANRFDRVQFIEEYQLSPADVIFPDEPVRSRSPSDDSTTLTDLLDKARPD